MNINQVLANLLELFGTNESFPMVFGFVGVLSYLVLSFFLGRIYKKAGQPLVSAFIPVWNIIVFFRLGGYSGLWVVGAILSYAYIFGTAILTANQLNGANGAYEGVNKLLVETMPVGVPLLSLLLVATSLVAVLAAYNIGRAFEKDAGYLLLFVFLYPVWTLALAFTAYDWDEESANPNSIGVMNRTKLRRERAQEVATNRARAARFLEPVAPTRASDEEPESDYDRALREQEARGGVPAQKKSRRKSKDPADAKIVDSGSTGADTDSDWF